MTIVAWGFTAAQPNGNFYEAPYNGMPKPPWTTTAFRLSSSRSTSLALGVTAYEQPGRIPNDGGPPKIGHSQSLRGGNIRLGLRLQIPEPSSFILGVTGGARHAGVGWLEQGPVCHQASKNKGVRKPQPAGIGFTAAGSSDS